MTPHYPSLNVFLAPWQHLVDGFCCIWVLALHDSGSGFGQQVLVRVGVLYVCKSNVCSLVEVVLQQEINELKEDLVTVIRLDLLVFSSNSLVVYDSYSVINSLGPVVLWVVVLGG